MKKNYLVPSLKDLFPNENADVIRTSGLFAPRNAAEQQALDDYLAGFGVKTGIGKYTK